MVEEEERQPSSKKTGRAEIKFKKENREGRKEGKQARKEGEKEEKSEARLRGECINGVSPTLEQ